MEKRLCIGIPLILAMCLGIAVLLPWVFFKNQSLIARSTSGSSNCVVDSPCGTWIPYGPDKCIKLITSAGFQTKEDGERICRAYAKEFQTHETSKLVTIKTREQQTILQTMLFEDLGTLQNVWLGLHFGKDHKFRWNDGTDLTFSNLITDNLTQSERRCVQMDYGDRTNETGMWIRSNCMEKYAVVCERTQLWSVATLQNILVSLNHEVIRIKQEIENNPNDTRKEYEKMLKRSLFLTSLSMSSISFSEVKKEIEQKLIEANREFDRKFSEAKYEFYQKLNDAKSECDNKLLKAKKEADQKRIQAVKEYDKKLSDVKTEANKKIDDSNLKISEVNTEVTQLKQNPVPLGFIYFQLPEQEPPTSLWPRLSWKDVGYQYAGLFFRVEGGGAAVFGEIQEDNTRSLAQVTNRLRDGDAGQTVMYSNGSWSKYILTGTIKTDETILSLQFRMKSGEVRPRNTAIKIWKRIN